VAAQLRGGGLDGMEPTAFSYKHQLPHSTEKNAVWPLIFSCNWYLASHFCVSPCPHICKMLYRKFIDIITNNESVRKEALKSKISIKFRVDQVQWTSDH